jgi:hypothetical protein
LRWEADPQKVSRAYVGRFTYAACHSTKWLKSSWERLSEKSLRCPKRGPTRHPNRPIRPVLTPIHVPNTRPEHHPHPFSEGFKTAFSEVPEVRF